MPEKLTLNDGTVIAGHALEMDDRLLLYMDGITLEDAFGALKDPEKTGRIIEDRNGQETVHEGFVHLYTVTEEWSGMITAGLRRGGN